MSTLSVPRWRHDIAVARWDPNGRVFQSSRRDRAARKSESWSFGRSQLRVFEGVFVLFLTCRRFLCGTISFFFFFLVVCGRVKMFRWRVKVWIVCVVVLGEWRIVWWLFLFVCLFTKERRGARGKFLVVPLPFSVSTILCFPGEGVWNIGNEVSFLAILLIF